jgi:hypothetical protein
MSGERLKKAQSIFEELSDLPPSQRGAILVERCGDDQELRGFVGRLLASNDQGLGNFLQSPEIEITKLFGGRGSRRDTPSD